MFHDAQASSYRRFHYYRPGIANGDLTSSAITTGQTIYDMLARRVKQAGIDNFSPHNLRHSAISEMWDKGIDGVTIRDIAGHSSIETTANYDRRGEERKSDAADKMDVPL